MCNIECRLFVDILNYAATVDLIEFRQDKRPVAGTDHVLSIRLDRAHIVGGHIDAQCNGDLCTRRVPRSIQLHVVPECNAAPALVVRTRRTELNSDHYDICTKNVPNLLRAR